MATEADLDYEEQETEEEDDRRRRALPWIILLIIFAVVLWLLWNYGGWRDQDGDGSNVAEVKQLISVPDLIGVDGESAERLLERLGLIPDVVVSYDTQGDPGTVSDQDPGAGVQVRQGSTVRIWVIDVTARDSEDETAEPDYAGEAKGVTMRTRTVPTRVVPDVTGLSEAAARARLVAAGFVLRPMYQPQVGGDYTVSQQKPAAGETAVEGLQIHVLIAVPR